jgi:HAD superfamily hydrolase (TIGR01509 family)
MSSIYLQNKPGSVYPYKMKDGHAAALRAIIFDCDGVLVDSEPAHFEAFKRTLGVDGASMTEELYKERYLAMDDRGIFTTFYQNAGKPLDSDGLKKMMDAKTLAFQSIIQNEGLMAYPAVPEFVMAVSQRYPLAVASGARRHELETVLESAGIRSFFEVVVSADDVEYGKPHPESYLKAVEELNASGKRTTPIKPEECVVIEDSKDGIASAHAAGMKCVAVATSFPVFELAHADLVVPALASLRVSQIEDLFHAQPVPMPAPAPESSN